MASLSRAASEGGDDDLGVYQPEVPEADLGAPASPGCLKTDPSEQGFSSVALQTFGAREFLVVGGVLCIVGCLAATLGSTY